MRHHLCKWLRRPANPDYDNCTLQCATHATHATPLHPLPPTHRVAQLHVGHLVLLHAAVPVQAVHRDAVKGAVGAHACARIDLPPQPAQQEGWNSVQG